MINFSLQELVSNPLVQAAVIGSILVPIGMSFKARAAEHLLWDEFCNTFKLGGRNVFNHRGTGATAFFYGDDLSISNNGQCIFKGPTWELSDQPETLIKLLQNLGVSIANHPRPDMEEPQQ